VSKRCLGPRPSPSLSRFPPSVSSNSFLFTSISPSSPPHPTFLSALIFLNFYCGWTHFLRYPLFPTIFPRNDQTPQRTPVVDTPTEPVRAHSGDDTIAVDFDPRLRRNRPEPSISLHMAPSAPGTASNSPAKKTSAPEKKYKCQFCNRAFSRSEHRSRHERSRKWFPSIPLDPSLSLYFIAG
jgi:hypothetical protein